jgi:bacillithiol system protein YtxJ
MRWNLLVKEDQLEQLIEESEKTPVLIFKHSTRCAISKSALHRVESFFGDSDTTFLHYYVDVLENRNISSLISNLFKIEHQSPQVLIIIRGECTYNSSHMRILPEKIIAAADK